MSLADLLLDLPLVFKERFQGLIEVFLDEILDQLVIHSNEPNEERDGQRIEFWRIEFENDLSQELSRDVGGGLSINDSDVIALLNQGTDFLECEVPAMRCIIISAIGILLDFENLVRAILRHQLIVDFAVAQRKRKSSQYRHAG